MFRSSTSSSDGRRRWRIAVIVSLSVVLLAEVALRVPGVEAVVGPPDLYYHPGVQERLAALEALEADGQHVDVLFVGSSVVRTNLSPLVFDAALAEAGIDVTSFNAGLSALRPDPVRLYLERLWLDAVEPRIVFQAVRYEDLADAVPVAEFEPFDAGRYEQLWLSDSPLAHAQEAMLESSRLVQYAGVLTEILALPDSLREEGFEIDERGFNPTELILADVRREIDIEDIPGGKPAANGYDQPLDESVFRFGLEVLEATIAEVEATGASFVLVNMPEHGEKFVRHRGGIDRYEQYLDTIREFAAAQGIVFIDLSVDGPAAFTDDTRFADFNHMTPGAAEDLTRLLANMVADHPVLGAKLRTR